MLKENKRIYFVLLILSLFLPVFVSAKNIDFDEKVGLSGEYDATVIAGGNEVRNEGQIDGLALLLGNNVKNEGVVDYGLFAGNSITVNGKVNHDLFVAGNIIDIKSEAEIPRDAYIACSDLKVNTNIGRNLYVACGTVDLSGITINGNATIYADSIKMDKDTVIVGKFKYSDSTKVNGLDDASIGEKVVVHTKEAQEEAKKALLAEKVKSWIFSVITAYVTLLIVFYLFPRLKEKLSEQKVDVGEVAKTAAIGFIGLVFIPVVSLFALFTRVLTPLSLLTFAVYAFSIYFAFLFVYAIVGRLLYSLTKKESNIFIELIIGILVVKLVSLIPYVGGIVGAISLFYGLGLIINYIRGSFRK